MADFPGIHREVLRKRVEISEFHATKPGSGGSARVPDANAGLLASRRAMHAGNRVDPHGNRDIQRESRASSSGLAGKRVSSAAMKPGTRHDHRGLS